MRQRQRHAALGGCVVAAVAFQTHPTTTLRAPSSRQRNARVALPTQRRLRGGGGRTSVATAGEARARGAGVVTKPTALLITSVGRLHSEVVLQRRRVRVTH